MASPIFLSNPSESFSIWIILRGIQFGILSIYRSSQNPLLLDRRSLQVIFYTVKLTLVLASLTSLPIYLIKKFHSPDSQIIFLIKHFINPDVFLISFTYYFSSIFDRIFLFNLKFIDKTNGSAYYETLIDLPTDEIERPEDTGSVFPSYEQLKAHVKNSAHFKSFLKRYTEMLSYNLLVFVLVTEQNKITSLFLTFTAFQTFYHKLGSIPSFLLIALLNVLPYDYTAISLTSFYACSNMSTDFLSPYINRMNPTKLERSHWLNSRSGVLFGYSLVYFMLMSYYTSFAVVFYMLGQMNTAYLITKLSNSPPPPVSQETVSDESVQKQSNPLINWFSTQLIWNNQFSFLEGGFLNDPFFPIPGSFLLD